MRGPYTGVWELLANDIGDSGEPSFSHTRAFLGCSRSFLRDSDGSFRLRLDFPLARLCRLRSLLGCLQVFTKLRDQFTEPLLLLLRAHFDISDVTSGGSH